MRGNDSSGHVMAEELYANARKDEYSQDADLLDYLAQEGDTTDWWDTVKSAFASIGHTVYAAGDKASGTLTGAMSKVDEKAKEYIGYGNTTLENTSQLVKWIAIGGIAVAAIYAISTVKGAVAK